ncbi:MAG: hypothetical protein AAGU11_21365, partial [Syntrophobacteraceae bacterium]
FIVQVKGHFQFLTDEYGFVLESQNPYAVTYASTNLVVSISHEQLSYELEVEFSRWSSNQSLREIITLGEILDWRRVRKTVNPTVLQASSPESVEICVPILSDLTRTYASDILDGSSWPIAEISTIRAYFTENLENRHLRQIAQEAWRTRNYRVVAHSLMQIRGNLTELEGRKLSLSIRRIRDKLPE